MKGILFEPVDSPYLVPYDESFKVARAPTQAPKEHRDKKGNKSALEESIKRIRQRQRKLNADDRYSLLLVFQAMDAAGKDGTIRAVMTGINPAGCQVFSFKQPSSEELDHDFMWRIYRRLPERGRIGIFNRSHYEEVLVVRVHPEYLDGQRLPPSIERKGERNGERQGERKGDLEALWEERLQSIRNFERHLARNGTAILKFWLNVSKDEQRSRFLDRIDEPESNWKFSFGDVKERQLWDKYMNAYEHALNATSRPWAPWYAIPADNKPYMRRVVADIVAKTLKRLDIAFPTVSEERRAEMLAMRDKLVAPEGE